MLQPPVERFEALGAFLARHACVWRPRPFCQLPVTWEAEHPEVAAFVDGLGPEPPAWRAWTDEAQRLAAMPAFPPAVRLDPRWTRGLPGRKVMQIAGLAAACPAAGALVDWCAGKGHLGRTLARLTGATLTALEWDAALCRDGRALCDAAGVPARFVCGDALGPDAAALLDPSHFVVALHACGDLHAALLRAAVERGVAGLALAPCCYNRGTPGALSRAGAAAGLALDRDDLDLIHREQVVAGPAERERTHLEMARRLGYDLLQRDVRGVDAYRSMPPFPRAWLALPFDEFCRRFAEIDGLGRIPADVSPFERAGVERLHRVLARDRVRALFRAPLEAWLLLDRARFLEEHGYRVDVGTFCARDVTPRNTLLLARRG
jgi:hypothetical protein